MIVTLESVLTPDEVDRIVSRLETAQFADGRATAGATIGVALCRTGRMLIVLPEAGSMPQTGMKRPKVSVIVPARDEGENIERTIRSLAAQDYPALEIVAVDDRSGDDTGDILHRLAAELPVLRVISVETLPQGWLGKNHANWLAAREASGEVFLFTDGDVLFAPGALTAAVDCMLRRGLGHLAGVPLILTGGVLERAFQTAHLVDLAFLAPDIVEAIVTGRQPVTLTADALIKSQHQPLWVNQRAMIATL